MLEWIGPDFFLRRWALFIVTDARSLPTSIVLPMCWSIWFSIDQVLFIHIKLSNFWRLWSFMWRSFSYIYHFNLLIWIDFWSSIRLLVFCIAREVCISLRRKGSAHIISHWCFIILDDYSWLLINLTLNFSIYSLVLFRIILIQQRISNFWRGILFFSF